MNFQAPTLCILTLTISGCATTYSQPKANEPHATVNFIQSYGDHNYLKQFLTQGRHQVFQIMAEDNCTSPLPTVSFHSGAMDGAKQTKKIHSGSPLRIISAVTVKDVASGAYTPAGGEILTNNCGSVAMFTPLEGHLYDIKMNFKSITECELSVIDLASSEAPADLLVGHEKVCK